ncbi:MAG: PQQ-binding-like beta-propeller repeat protein, partial [Bacteroidetes bacterium]|nr:PQQ-binding-like beta-propeller repeat protein [Bacteroidota bacterium]
SCFDSKGNKVWSLDMMKEFAAPNITWGFTESLLIDGNNLYCTPGASDVAVAVLDRNTGKVLKKIKGNGQASTYCSPVIITHNGRRILLQMMAESLIGIDVKSAEMIFEHKHITDYNINPNTPQYENGHIYIVSGYGTGGQLLRLSTDGGKITRVWASDKLDSQMGATIIHDGNIYGSGMKSRKWFCIDLMTGQEKFTSGELGRKGNIIFADEMLYIYSEKGDVALVKPNDKKFDIVSSFKLTDGSGEHWAHPVIKNGKLYVRHGNILNIYNIAR